MENEKELMKEIKKLKKQVSKKKRTKGKKPKKILGKPKVKIKKYDSVKAISRIAEGTAPLVREGQTGYFRKEYIKEKANFLS